MSEPKLISTGFMTNVAVSNEDRSESRADLREIMNDPARRREWVASRRAKNLERFSVSMDILAQ